MRSGPFSVPHSRRTPSLFHSSQSPTFHVSCCSGQENQLRFTETCWILRLYIASLFCENLNLMVCPSTCCVQLKMYCNELNAVVFLIQESKSSSFKSVHPRGNQLISSGSTVPDLRVQPRKSLWSVQDPNRCR